MCATRRLRISAANIGPNRFHQNRTVSWLMSIPRSAKRSSTLRSDSWYRTYIITTRRMTSGEPLKYRNGLLMCRGEHSLDSPRICSDTALGRIEHRIEHTEPAFDGFIAANRRHQKIAGPGRGDIGHSDGFPLIAAQLFVGGFQQLDRSRTA